MQRDHSLQLFNSRILETEYCIQNAAIQTMIWLILPSFVTSLVCDALHQNEARV